MTPAKPKSFSDWLQGFLTPQVLILVFTALVAWGVRIELHVAKDSIHVPRTTMDACYVQSVVDTEKQRRIDEKLTEIGKALDGIEQLLREEKHR